jgi:hypothetical protein
VASQGSPVRLGYGRLRVGSQVIASSIRNKDTESEKNPFLEDGEEGNSIGTSDMIEFLLTMEVARHLASNGYAPA